MGDCIDRYMGLVAERADLFAPEAGYSYVVDEARLREASTDGAPLGLLYASDYHYLLVDLIQMSDGAMLRYERFVQRASGRGVVVVPESEDGIVLLQQERPPAGGVFWGFPRGFGEDGLEAHENARKEVTEELSCTACDFTELGSFVADTGVTGDRVVAFNCTVADVAPSVGYEGTLSWRAVSYEELRTMVRAGEIDDGMTLSALRLYEAAKGLA